jgi:hypothetical protein
VIDWKRTTENIAAVAKGLRLTMDTAGAMESRAEERAPSHSPWKTPAKTRRRFPHLPQTLLATNRERKSEKASQKPGGGQFLMAAEGRKPRQPGYARDKYRPIAF